MEKIILKRLLHYCGKKKKEKKEKKKKREKKTEDIIPANQAGFRKGRCTTDHLVKLTSHIKNSFRGEKVLWPHYFVFKYVKKAYDCVWHARLLHKLKNIGITGVMFQYLKNFLSERCICTRAGKTYSSSLLACLQGSGDSSVVRAPDS